MQIGTRDRGEVRLLEPHGKLTFGSGADPLHEAVRDQLKRGRTRLLVDLSRVTKIDSTGMGVLVACLTSAKSQGGAFKLLRPSPTVEDIFRITEAGVLFEIYDDEQQAVDSFS